MSTLAQKCHRKHSNEIFYEGVWHFSSIFGRISTRTTWMVIVGVNTEQTEDHLGTSVWNYPLSDFTTELLKKELLAAWSGAKSRWNGIAMTYLEFWGEPANLFLDNGWKKNARYFDRVCIILFWGGSLW